MLEQHVGIRQYRYAPDTYFAGRGRRWLRRGAAVSFRKRDGHM